jgi:hypothetical protein
MSRRRHASPLVDGWVCPRCGQVGDRHGRSGARGCQTRQTGPRCPGLVCECEDGLCYSKSQGFGWRRSPCLNAHCLHCGWRGEIRSRPFERAYGMSRCPKSGDGWHHPLVTISHNTEADAMHQRLHCPLCGIDGTVRIHPIRDIDWRRPEEQEQRDDPTKLAPVSDSD